MPTLGVNGLTPPAPPKPDDGVAQRLIANLNNSEKGVLHHCYAYAWAIIRGAGGKGNATAPKDQSAMGQPIGYLDTLIKGGSLHVGDVIYVNKKPGADPSSTNLAYGPHWFVYMGNGQFADQYGIKQNAAAMNAFVPGRQIDSIFHCFNGSPADPPPGALAAVANSFGGGGSGGGSSSSGDSSRVGGSGSPSSLSLPGNAAGGGSAAAVVPSSNPAPPVASTPQTAVGSAQDSANRTEAATALGYSSSQMDLVWNLLGPIINDLNSEDRKKKLAEIKDALKGVDLTDPAAVKAAIAKITSTAPVASTPPTPETPATPATPGPPATSAVTTSVTSDAAAVAAPVSPVATVAATIAVSK